jgi:hypothetical protein
MSKLTKKAPKVTKSNLTALESEQDARDQVMRDLLMQHEEQSRTARTPIDAHLQPENKKESETPFMADFKKVNEFATCLKNVEVEQLTDFKGDGLFKLYVENKILFTFYSKHNLILDDNVLITKKFPYMSIKSTRHDGLDLTVANLKGDTMRFNIRSANDSGNVTIFTSNPELIYQEVEIVTKPTF